MKTLYKWLPSAALAKTVASGVFRFYELTKYIKMEDEQGRADDMEGSIGFSKEESKMFPDKLMKATFTPQGGDPILMNCSSIKQGEEFLRQYFVFCLSKSSKRVIKDCPYCVILGTETFDLIENFLFSNANNLPNCRKTFSHGDVIYYDIHNHAKNISQELWKEAYLKHSRFEAQDEYRASLFVSNNYFDRLTCNAESSFLEVSKNGKKIDCVVEIIISSGVDEEGWRYIQIDTNDIIKKLNLSTPEFLTTCDNK